MKKYLKSILFLGLILGLSISLIGQAKKPTIMLVPSMNYCNQQGYVMKFENQGTTITVPDFATAVNENPNLLLVTAKIGELMAERGFPLVDLGATLRTLNNQSAEDAMYTSRTGAEVNESPIDKLKKTARADIWIEVTWTLNEVGPQKSVTFILQGIDSYTNKQIASASGTGSPSNYVELPLLLEEAVLSHLDNFNYQLQNHFDDLFANGREVSLRILTFNSFDGDLESEYNGEELNFIIEDWVWENTVEGRFNLTDATQNMMMFEQVRIPLYDPNSRAMDTRYWARNLQRFLKSNYDITAKLTTRGLGQAQLIIGEK